MSYDPDPLTVMYNKQWEVLRAHFPITDFVKIGNQIIQTVEEPVFPKEDVVDADLPEIRVLPAGGTIENIASTGTMVVEQNYEIQVAVQDARLNAQFFPLQWEIIVAYVKAGCDLGLDFVEVVRLGNYTDEENDVAVLRGLEGWSSLMSVAVRMRFDLKTMV